VSRVVALVAKLGDSAAVAARAGPPSAATLERLALLRAPRRAAQSALARPLAALAAARLLGRPYPASLVAESDDRPWLREAGGLKLSLAHCRDRVAVVVGEGPLGVDIEYCDPRRDVVAIGRQACATSEVAWLLRGAPAERLARFYLLFTLREAAFKAGLRPGALGGEPCLGRGAARYGRASRAIDGYRISVAGEAPLGVEWFGVEDGELVPLASRRPAPHDDAGRMASAGQSI
jgi:4'-phosphopantetheinyl transferase